jgi:hypothetical protein
MEAPWISAYQLREWIVYQVFVQSEDWLTLTESLGQENDLTVCMAESEMAADHWRRTQSVDRVFYPDFEQLLGMNLDYVYGADLATLTQEWKGHPTGSLVMITYKGVKSEPRYMTIGVAKA